MQNFIKILNRIIQNCALPLVLILFICFQWSSQGYFSPVYDELANIPAAYNLIETDRYPDPSHPPLFRYTFTIPLYFYGADALADDATGATQWKPYGKNFLFKNNIPWQNILHATRLVNILFGAAFLVFLYFFCKKRWGTGAGILSLLFLAFEPSFLAFSGLVTLDLAHCLSYFLGAVSIERYLRKPSTNNFWLLHLGLAFAFLCKFSAFPLFLVAIVGIILFRKRQHIALKPFFLSPVIFAVLIFAAYRFQIKKPIEDLQLIEALESPNATKELAKWENDYDLKKIMQTNIPVYDFWKGFGMQVFHSGFQDKWQKQSSFQFLDGAYNRRGWRSYFLCTFLWKSTLACLLLVSCLVVLGLRIARKSTNRFPNPTTFTFIAAPLFLFCACSMSTINIGHRYILPIYPFIAVGIAFLFAHTKQMRPAIVLLIVAHLASSLWSTPHHLAYFNELARDRFRLADSNIDWGQDLLYLKEDVEKSRTQYGKNMWANCFGLVQPEDLQINVQPIPKQEILDKGKHIVYLSVNNYLNRSVVNPKGLHPWLLEKEPKRIIGSSILVYEFELQ